MYNEDSFVRKEVPVLDLNAFTAGVEPGGLTHGYEIKILVCYLLEQIGTGMTFTQISDALLHRSLVNYFELANALNVSLDQLLKDSLKNNKQGSIVLEIEVKSPKEEQLIVNVIKELQKGLQDL